MKRGLLRGAAIAALLLSGFGLGLAYANRPDTVRVERAIALSWGDGKYGPAFYGAYVYLQPVDGGYSVRARVYIGRGNGYVYDCGELGRAQSEAEAVARWGKIDWREEGLRIGSGADQYFLPRADLENHR
jgi:hypothetical protein